MSQVYIYDEFNPEDIAMMQALYSRSPESVTTHVQKVKESGSGKFMEKFYVGYGHQSIADCGSTTIFIEKLSMLADKAIQDWPLYAGQETSTRYVDMSKQKIIDPINTSESQEILKNWMDFYINSQDELKNHLKINYPIKENQKEEIYDKAITARCFDIMRGFLPAGITTQLSWHTNLRQAWDKLALMQYHPLTETREIAQKIISNLKEKYPNSFCHEKFKTQEEYRQLSMQNYNYLDPAQEKITEFQASTTIQREELLKYQDLITKRPIKTNLPIFLAELGQFKFKFLLDFGSFRDIQRHRNGTCRMPLLTTDLKFHQWYLNELPDEIKTKAEKLISEQTTKIKNLNATKEEKQYYIAMGFNVFCSVSYGLPATIYTTELRSGKLVHPTLRKIAHKMHYSIKENFKEIVMHTDLEKSKWDIQRGKQDIINL